jgi:hypothetical protein
MGEPPHERAGQDGGAGDGLTPAISDIPGRPCAAGVAVTTVRYDGITHDFMMLNQLRATHAIRGAVAQAIATLRQALHTA